MVETIIVTVATLIAARTVEVKGRKDGLAPREWTVHFNRKGDIQYAYQYVPEEGYMYPDMIPDSVIDAATQEFKKKE